MAFTSHGNLSFSIRKKALLPALAGQYNPGTDSTLLNAHALPPEGLEPSLRYRKRILSPQRLPIPPRRHGRKKLQNLSHNTIIVNWQRGIMHPNTGPVGSLGRRQCYRAPSATMARVYRALIETSLTRPSIIEAPRILPVPIPTSVMRLDTHPSTM